MLSMPKEKRRTLEHTDGRRYECHTRPQEENREAVEGGVHYISSSSHLGRGGTSAEEGVRTAGALWRHRYDNSPRGSYPGNTGDTPQRGRS